MNVVKTVSVPLPPFNQKEILRYCGTKTDDKQTLGLINECIGEIDGKLKPLVCYTEFGICKCDDCLDLGFCKTNSELLLKHLKGCNKIILFAVTIGTEIDRLIMKYSKLSPSKALVFQSIGTERIESLCDAFENSIDKNRVSRVSAGYGDIPLTMQNDIFKALDCQRKIGLTLNDSLLMSPTKSVTAIIGVCDEY